jgi:outer membrane immunogenic protein
LLTYINGGWTQTHFNQINLNLFSTVLAFSYIPATTYNGWFLGGGTETALAGFFPGLPGGLFLRSEYRFSTFSSKDVPIIGSPPNGEHMTKYVQTISTALVWKFNWVAH